MPKQSIKLKGTGKAPCALRSVNWKLRQILGPPPLYPGESLEAYQDLHERLRQRVFPEDIIEELLVRDLTDLSWEILRFRRLKADRTWHRITQKLFEILKTAFVGDEQKALDLISLDAGGNRSATMDIDFTLKRTGYPRGTIESEVVGELAHDLQYFELLISQCETRRDVLLREFDRRRDAPTRRVREAVVDIEDDDYKVLPNNSSVSRQ